MPQFDLNFDFGHPGGKTVNTTSTELLRPRAAKPTVAQEALIRRNRAGYTRKELSQRGTPQKTGLPAESTTINADRRKDKNTIEWAGTEIDRIWGKQLDPETRATYISWLWSKANGGRTKGNTKAVGGRTLTGFEPYVRELVDKVSAGKMNDIRKDVAAYRAATKATPEETDVGVDQFGGRYPTMQGDYAAMVRQGVDPAEAERRVARLVSPIAPVSFTSTDTPSPERQNLYNSLIRQGMEPYEAARSVIAQTAPNLTPQESARMANALAGIAPNSNIGDERNLPGPRSVRDAYTKAARASRDLVPIQSEDVDVARADEPTYMGQMGKNLGNSWLKSQNIRGRDASKASNLDLWIDAAAAGQQPFTTALLMGSGKAIEEHSAEERGFAMVGDFIAQIVLTGATKAAGKAASRMMAGEVGSATSALAGVGARSTVNATKWGENFAARFGKTSFGQLLTKEYLSEGAIQAALARMGASGSTKGVIIARQALTGLGNYAPEFLALDLPGFAYMVKESGGDPFKAVDAFADQITSGFRGGFDADKPFDEQVSAGIGLATGIMMAVGAFTMGYSALLRIKRGGAGVSPLAGTDFRQMTTEDIAHITKGAESIRATGASEEGFAKLSNDIKQKTGLSAMEIATEARQLMDQQGITAKIGETAANKLAMDIGTVKAAGEALDAVKSGIKGEDAEGTQRAKQAAPDAQSEQVSTPPATDTQVATTEGAIVPAGEVSPPDMAQAPNDLGPAPIATPVPSAPAAPVVDPESRYADETNPEALLAASKEQAKSHFDAVTRIETALQDPRLSAKQKDELNKARAESMSAYAGTINEVSDAFGAEQATAMRGEIEQSAGLAEPATPPAKPAAPVQTTPQTSAKPPKPAAPKPAEIKAALGKVSDTIVKRVIETKEVKNAQANSPDNLKVEVLAQVKQHLGDLIAEMAKGGITPAEAKVLNEINTPESMDSLAEVIVKGLKPAKTATVNVIESPGLQRLNRERDRHMKAVVEAAQLNKDAFDLVTSEAGDHIPVDAFAASRKKIDAVAKAEGLEDTKDYLRIIAAGREPGVNANLKIAAKRLLEYLEKADEPKKEEPKPKKVYNTDKSLVEAALKKGEYVNPDIVADYPDLVEKYGKANAANAPASLERDGKAGMPDGWDDANVSIMKVRSAARMLGEEFSSNRVVQTVWNDAPALQTLIRKELERRSEQPSNKTQAQNEPEKAAPSNDRQVNEKATPPKEEPKAEAPKDGEIPKADSEGYGANVSEETKRRYEEVKARRKKAREEAAAGGQMKAGSGIPWDEGDYDDLLTYMKYHAEAIGQEALKAAKAVKEMIARALGELDMDTEPDKVEVDKSARLAMRSVGFTLDEARALIEAQELKDGETTIVYRLGWKGEKSAAGKWVGDAARVAQHINTTEDGNKSAGDTLFAYEVPNGTVDWKKQHLGNAMVLPDAAESRLIASVPYDSVYKDHGWSILDVKAGDIEKLFGQSTKTTAELRKEADAAIEAKAPNAKELDRIAGEREIADADAAWDYVKPLGFTLPDEAKIVNDIDPSLKPSEKLAKLKELTEENKPIIQAIIDKMASEHGLEGKLSTKLPWRVLSKSVRPSIKEESPWYGIEHVRDTLRFKLSMKEFANIEQFAAALPEGTEVIKIDSGKMFNPKLWGWRFWGVDLKMPNGQIVEMYMPIEEVEAAKAEGHLIYEKWRTKTADELKAQDDAYQASVKRSRKLYKDAFDAGLERMGYSDERQASKDFEAASERASSVIGSKRSSSSGGSESDSQDPALESTPARGRLESTSASSNTTTLPVDGSSYTRNSDTSSSTSNISIDDSAAKAVQKGGYRSYNQAKGRGVMVYGVGKDAPVLKWASDIQRDLFELHKQVIKTAAIKGRGKSDVARKQAGRKVIELIGQSIEEQTGLSGKEVLAAAGKVYDDVRAQMKGVGKGQAKGLDENLFGVGEKLGYNKQSDDQSGTRNTKRTDAGQGSGSIRLLADKSPDALQGANEGGNAGSGVPERGQPDTGAVPETGADGGPGSGERPADSSSSGDLRPDGDRGTGQSGANAPKPVRRPKVDGQFDSGNLVIRDGDTFRVPSTYDGKLALIPKVFETLHAIEDRGGKATREEKLLLQQYPGWGWTGDTLNPANANNPKSAKYNDYHTLMDPLTPDERVDAFRAILNSHYTSPEIIASIWDGLRRLGIQEGRPLFALEPSAGSGLFVSMSGMDGIHWRLVEKDGLTSRILKAIHTDAEVVSGGFERTPKGQNVDLAISNVPFGNFGISDVKFAKDHGKWATGSIHNYFIARMITETRDNGIIVAITSRYTMDGTDADHVQMREFMHQNAELLLAVRLPETAFKDVANTSVVTDLLIMRKRVPGEAIGPNPYAGTSELVDVQSPEGEIPTINDYYVANPDHLLGENAMVRTQFGYGYALKGKGDLIELLNAAMKQLPRDIFEHGDARERDAGPAVRVPNDVRSGGLFGTKEQGIYRNDGGTSVKMDVHAIDAKLLPKKFQSPTGRKELQATMEARTLSFFKIRDAVHATISGMRNGVDDPGLSELQTVLRETIDAYRKAHGPLNMQNLGSKSDPIYPWWLDDPDGPTVAALEVFDFDTKEVKGYAALVTSRNIDPIRRVTKADNATDALYASLHNSGKVDVKEMAKLANMTEKAVAKELQGVIFYDHATKEWQLKDQYAQGNVREKLKAAQEAGDKEAVKYLESIMPADRKPSQISAALGASWMDVDVFEDFIYHLLGGERPTKMYGTPAKNEQVFVEKKQSDNKSFNYSVEIGSNAGNARATATANWATPDVNLNRMIKSALNNIDITVYDETRDSKTKNVEKTAQANEIKNRMREEFRNWLFSDVERTEKVVKHYNERVNVFSSVAYDGAHITVPGAEPWVMERSQRKAGVWRILTSKTGTLLSWEVGTGKTLTMGAAAMEGRRTGLVKKAMYVAHNATVAQTAAEIARGFPGSRLLVANDFNFSSKQRKSFLAQAAVGDYDIIILAQSHFELIAAKDETKRKVLQAQIDELQKVDVSGESRARAKQISKQIETLVAKMERHMEAQKGDRNTVFFEDLGVDMLLIDEAHAYKNLARASKQSSLAIPGSSRATDVAVKLEAVRATNDGTGRVVMATGTPIINSLGETHTWLKFLAPEQLIDMGLYGFDDFINAYALPVPVVERTPGGAAVRKIRFSKFVNAPNMRRLFKTVADTVRAQDMVNAAGEKSIDLPKYVDLDGKPVSGPISEVISATYAQREFFAELSERYKAWQALSAKARAEQSYIPLVLTMEGRLASIDIRLVRPNAPFDEDGKIATVVRNTLKVYRNYKTEKAVQAIFLDSGVPGGARFNLYEDIIMRLVEGGIPRSEILNIYDLKRDEVGPAMVKANAGEYRVVLGSTERLGTGINMQRRLRVGHHVDAAWVASGLMQRDGRVMRSGNQFADSGEFGGGVSLVYYSTENSPEARLWTVINRKVQLMNDVLYTADSEFGDDVEDIDPPSSVMSYAELTAATQGDPKMVRYIDIQGELQVMGSEFALFERQGSDRRYALQRIEADTKKAKTLAKAYEGVRELKKTEHKWSFQGVSLKLETREALGEFIQKNLRPFDYGGYSSMSIDSGDTRFTIRVMDGTKPMDATDRGDSNRITIGKFKNEALVTVEIGGSKYSWAMTEWFSTTNEDNEKAPRTAIAWQVFGPLKQYFANPYATPRFVQPKSLMAAVTDIMARAEQELGEFARDAEKLGAKLEKQIPDIKKVAEAEWPKMDEYRAMKAEEAHLVEALGLNKDTGGDLTWAVNEASKADVLSDGDDVFNPDSEIQENAAEEVATTLGMPARTAAPGGSKWYRADIEPLAVPAGVDPKALSADAVMMSVPRTAVGNWRFGKTLRGLVGQMNPKNKTITMRYHGSPHEFAHEIGHHLDDQYRLVPQMKPVKTRAGSDHPWMKEFDKEILPMGDPFSPASADLTRRRQEGIARFVQLYMVAPGKANIEAPNFHKFFESKVPDTVLKDLREAGDKLRMIAGLDVVTRGGNQIEMEPSDIRKTSSMIAEAVGLSDGLKFPRYNIIGGFTTNWVDDLAGLEAAQKEAMLRLGIDEVLPSDDPTLLARTIKYHTQKINDIIQNGMIDAEGNRVTGPLSSILEPLDRTSMETLEKDLRDTMLLGVSERQLEEAQRVMQDADNEAAILRMDGEDEKADAVIARAKERADSMTGISGGILPDGDIQAALDIIAALKADPARHAALAKSLERMREVYDSVLEYAVEKGRFSRDQVDEIRDTHQQYIALQRMMDGDQGLSFLKSSSLKNVTKPIKQFKGSTRKIKSPFIAMLEQINSTIFEADRNEIVTAMVDLLGGNEGRMYQKSADLSDLAVKIALDDSNKKNSIVIYRDGKQERWELDEVVYRALDIVGSPDMFDGLKAVRAIVSFTRQAITTFPAFAFFKNPIRDTVARVIHSRVGSKPWDINLNPSKADRARFSQFGGSIMETDYLNDRDTYLNAQRKLMEEAVIHKPKGWIVAAPGRLWKAYVDLASRPEMANRLAEESRAFKFAKSKGWSDYDAQLYASQQARDLQDFRRGGRWARRVNQFIMFFNASVQGLDRAYRGQKADRWGYMFRIALYTVLAEIVVNQLASSQGQDAEEEYANLPAYQKDFFWNIRIGDAGYIRLPKPFELGLPASFIGRIMSGVRAQAQGNTREASRWFEGFMGNALKALLVVDENTFMGGPLAPLYETNANFDFFRKKSIIPPYEESMILEDRKGTARASFFGRMLQAASESIGQGVDSRKIDHVVQQTFGGYGKVATSLGKPDREVSPGDWLYMMTGLFTDKPAYGARDVQWVLNRAAQIGTRKPLKDEVEAYFDAETKEEKDDAAKELLRRAGEIRNEMEDAAAGLPAREGIDAQRALFDLKPRDRGETGD